MSNSILSVNNLHVSINNTTILNGVSFCVGRGELHVLMGPNGCGKSTLAQAIMGNPLITIVSGTIQLLGEEITAALPEVRAQKGLFVGFQHPVEIPGVGQMTFVRSVLASNAVHLDSHDAVKKSLVPIWERVGLPEHFLDRNINEGFSGGEKKRNEMFQLAVFNPHIAIMDEIDSGLDVDGSRMVGEELQAFIDKGKSLLLITHSGRACRGLNPDVVYIMKSGRIIKQAGKDLMQFVEEHGFESL